MTGSSDMISIVMAHYKREEHLNRTLLAYRYLHTPEELYNVEFVIVDDNGNESPLFWDVIERHSKFLNILAFSIDENTVNPAIPLNFAIKMSHGDVIVLTNPECLPVNQHILPQIEERLNGKSVCDLAKRYLSCACYSLNEEQTKTLISLPLWETPVDMAGGLAGFVSGLDFTKQITNGGESGWYNHSTRVEIDRNLHFLTAINRSDMFFLRGFDEDYAGGEWFEDGDFVRRLKWWGANIITADDLLCLHQYHYVLGYLTPEKLKNIAINEPIYYRKANDSPIRNLDREWGEPKFTVWLSREKQR